MIVEDNKKCQNAQPRGELHKDHSQLLQVFGREEFHKERL